MNQRRQNILKQRRINRTRMKLRRNFDKPRLAVYRSLRHIYAQIIDDTKGETLVAFSTKKPELKGQLEGKKKVQQAFLVGQNLALQAKEKGIEEVVFDRHGKIYAGRIKALADGARKGGLRF